MAQLSNRVFVANIAFSNGLCLLLIIVIIDISYTCRFSSVLCRTKILQFFFSIKKRMLIENSTWWLLWVLKLTRVKIKFKGIVQFQVWRSRCTMMRSHNVNRTFCRPQIHFFSYIHQFWGRYWGWYWCSTLTFN